MPDTHDCASPFKLVLTPHRAGLPAGHPITLRVLVRVQAPDAPAGAPPRPPLRVALVLDRSGSMSGAPLEEAKRCARMIVDGLAPGDRAAVIAFDDEVERMAPLTPADRKLTLAAAIASIDSGGSTDLHGGWRAGADELVPALAADDVHRVILLSDGCANAGETDLEAITGQCKALARQGVSTSTYGLGRSFNEDLMLAMAAAGGGNAYYGETAADLAEPFAAEFQLLTSLCARSLVLKVNAPPELAVRLRNEYEPVEGERAAWKLPDLAFAAEAWALLEVDVPPQTAGAAPLALPLTVALHASARDSTPLFLMAALPPLALVDDARWQALPVDPLVERRLLELEAADVLRQVRAAVGAHDWPGATRVVAEAAERFRGHEWAAAVLATMQRLVARRDAPLLAKEATYAGRAMHSRLAMREEADFSLGDLPEVPAFLRRKGEQGKGRREP